MQMQMKVRTVADVRKQQREFQIGVPIIPFPVLPTEERVDFILKNIL